MSYKPQKRSTAARAIAHLSAPGAPTRISTSDLAEAIAVKRDSLSTLLDAACRHDAIIKTLEAGRAFYSLPGAPPAETAPVDGPVVAPRFEACVWEDGRMDVWPTLMLENGGFTLTADDVRTIVRLAGGVVLA